MGQPTPHSPALLMLAAFSRHDEALRWARHRAARAWGEIVLESPVFDFQETDYYEPTMGPGLRKVFLAFAELLDPTEMVAVKLQTNRWEEQYAALGRHVEPRPLNLDPGYLDLGKLVLASLKEAPDKIYLGQGVWAHTCLRYRSGAFSAPDHSFPDFREGRFDEFLLEARALYKALLREADFPG